jgi:hypothetical protein
VLRLCATLDFCYFSIENKKGGEGIALSFLNCGKYLRRPWRFRCPTKPPCGPAVQYDFLPLSPLATREQIVFDLKEV